MKDILKDVKEDHHFNLLSGKTLKNLHELHDELEVMEDNVYGHHVSANNNDFHNWVRDIHQDAELANTLKKVKHRKEALLAVKNRIKEVESMVIKTKRIPPPQKRIISSTPRYERIFDNAHKLQAVAGIIAVLMLVAFVGIGLKASSITGAAVGASATPLTFFGGILGIFTLLVIALYVIKEKHGL